MQRNKILICNEGDVNSDAEAVSGENWGLNLHTEVDSEKETRMRGEMRF
jgi:hypothetical protein